MKEKAEAKYFNNNKLIGKATINVFGFSRGAAAARHFLSQELFITSYLKIPYENITFNFIGLFDTVASHGVIHVNDVFDLSLNIKDKPKKVIQLAAGDEYRENFKLTDITSSIKAGVGYQLRLPGVHSDIGGGYSEFSDEKRYLASGSYSSMDDSLVMKKLERVKQEYIKSGWYRPEEFYIEKTIAGYKSVVYTNTLYGDRKIIPNTYQYIPFAIMKQFSQTYAKMVFKDTTDTVYKVTKDLQVIKEKLFNYAIANDGINSLAVTLPHDQLKWLRNNYLHRSNKDDELSMAGRYNKNGEPDRDVLEG